MRRPPWRPWPICWLTSKAGKTRLPPIKKMMRMEIKRGIAVSPGVAIGPALVLDNEGFRIPQRFVEGDQAQAEILRLRSGLQAAAREARDIQQTVSDKLGKQYGAIFAAHAVLIEDPMLGREVERLIQSQSFAA